MKEMQKKKNVKTFKSRVFQGTINALWATVSDSITAPEFLSDVSALQSHRYSAQIDTLIKCK